MSNTLYIHIGYWIVILLILFVGYLIYPKKQKKSSKRAGKNFCIEQSCPQKVNTISTSLASLATHRYRIAKKMGLKEVKSVNEAITGMLRNEKY